MRRIRLSTLLAAVIVIVGTYSVWCWWDKGGIKADEGWWRVRNVSEYGKDAGRGNILAVQPFMVISDYSASLNFRDRMECYLSEARNLGLLNRKTVVVFPEYVGSWLVVSGQKRGIYGSPTVDRAMKLMVLSNPLAFAKARASAEGSDRTRDALFRMKASNMAWMYDEGFGFLAQQYGVTIVAGSIILPSPRIVDGRLEIGDGPLYNVCVVYGPDGKALGLVTKAFPTEDEQKFISAGKVEDLPVFDIPAGKLGVLICADAWFPQAYEVMKRKGASIIVSPSYGVGNAEVLKRKWSGYSGWDNPEDVDLSDPGKLTEEQAGMKYALPGRLPKSGIPNGMTVCLRGRLWDLGSHGTTIVVRKGKVNIAPTVDGAALVSLWL